MPKVVLLGKLRFVEKYKDVAKEEWRALARGKWEDVAKAVESRQYGWDPDLKECTVQIRPLTAEEFQTAKIWGGEPMIAEKNTQKGTLTIGVAGSLPVNVKKKVDAIDEGIREMRKQGKV